MLSDKSRQTLRTLASKYMEFATAPEQLNTQKLWIALNSGNMQRPMVTIDQIPWHEMDVNGELINTVHDDPYWTEVETRLRRDVYKLTHMPADMVLPPYIMIPRVLRDPDFRECSLPITEHTALTDAGNDIVSHNYINQFESMEDVEKIKFTELCADEQKESALMDEAKSVFEGIAQVKHEGVSLHLGLWDLVSMWMSIEEIYIMLIEEPEILHAVMNRVTTAALGWIEQGNKQALFDTASGMTHCSCTLEAPYPAEPVKGVSGNAWAFSMAQLFTSVAPSVTDEYEVAYMSKLFPHFANIYYGCCERLDDRLDIITKMPNLRKVSCSPWSHKTAFAEKLPKNLIMSQKPNPAMIGADTFDEGVIRADLRETIAAAKNGGVGLELLLKDNSTVKYQPQRLWEFSKIALEEVSR